MLSLGCRRFRARFSPSEPESGAAHRSRCAPCADYAQALTRAAALRLPLPERLRAELRSLPYAAAGGLLSGRLPMPELPLPAALRFRLQGIARTPGAERIPAVAKRREKPPAWITSPRYAIAASLLLTTLSASLLASLANRLPNLGPRAAGLVSREVSSPLVEARETGEKKLRTWNATAASRYGALRGGLDASVQDLHSRLVTLTHKEMGDLTHFAHIANFANIAGRLLPASPNKNRGGSETPGRERSQP
jgi:hypothetical protein